MNRRICASGMLVLTLGLALPALSGCSNGGSGDSTSVESVEVPYPEMAPTIGGDTAVKERGDSAPGSSGSGSLGSADSVQRAVVTTVSTVVEVPDVPAATARVIAATTAAKGYVQAQYSTATTGKSATTTLTVRIPTAQADQFLASVANLGTVTRTERSSDDVTAEVADVDARLANAKAGVVRLRALMAKATKVSDIVAIESALSERQAEAESLAAQQRVLADMTSLATMTVVLSPAPDSPPTGFVGGLTEGWNAFKSAVSTLARAMGYLVPFAILGLLLVGLTVVSVRSISRRRKEHASSASHAYAQPAQTSPVQAQEFAVAQAPQPTSGGSVPPSTDSAGAATSPLAGPYGTGTT